MPRSEETDAVCVNISYVYRDKGQSALPLPRMNGTLLTQINLAYKTFVNEMTAPAMTSTYLLSERQCWGVTLDMNNTIDKYYLAHSNRIPLQWTMGL